VKACRPTSCVQNSLFGSVLFDRVAKGCNLVNSSEDEEREIIIKEHKLKKFQRKVNIKCCVRF
jgi:hypothetical protein